MNVYVVTALNGKPPAARARPDDGTGFSRDSTSSVGFQVQSWGTGRTAGGPDEFTKLPTVGLGDIRGISIEGTADEFCRTLERQLDRPVVNETNLEGEFSFRVAASRCAGNDFLERLRDRLHLSVTPAERRVAVVVLKPR
jgi:hypothetical protein